MRSLLVAMAGLFVTALPLTAHEFWIEPGSFALEPGAALSAQVLIGEGFRGAPQRFEPRAFARAIWSGPDHAKELSILPIRDGAPRLAPFGSGQHILAVQSHPSTHVHASEAAFQAYLDGIGLTGRVNAAAASLRTDGQVIEEYVRFSKTLIDVGPDPGSDRRTGLRHEWLRETHGFRLYSGNRARADQPATLFCRTDANGDVTISTWITDTSGQITPDLPPGGQCLLNTVLLNRQPDGSWRSAWVSILFAV